jgi:hypothetical protein
MDELENRTFITRECNNSDRDGREDNCHLHPLNEGTFICKEQLGFNLITVSIKVKKKQIIHSFIHSVIIIKCYLLGGQMCCLPIFSPVTIVQ